jgi:crotonobetainyl-CoA:carnitine CoA-transferase CaiB-like acyl-CoA transferase
MTTGAVRDERGRGPLAGTVVVETATFMSGPYAGMMLADLGAEVIKVEPERGDPFRTYGRPDTTYSAVFANCNRGKRSVVIDLKDPAGHERMLELLGGADVFLANWRAGVAESLGLSDDVLTAANPRLVRCFVTGFGPTGPRAGEPAFDTVLQGLGGLCDALDTADVPVVIPGYPLDKVAATLATQAILAALLERERTGRGDRIELAMLDIAGYFDFADLFTNRVFVDREPPAAQNAQVLATRPVRTADGWIVVATVTGRQIAAACRALGHPEWADAIFAETDQADLVRVMFDTIERGTCELSTDDVLARFREHDVAAAPCLTIDEHLADAQVVHNRIYSIDEWDGIGRVRSVRYPASFASWGHLRARGRAPQLGEHTHTDQRREP